MLSRRNFHSSSSILFLEVYILMKSNSIQVLNPLKRAAIETPVKSRAEEGKKPNNSKSLKNVSISDFERVCELGYNLLLWEATRLLCVQMSHFERVCELRYTLLLMRLLSFAV